MVSPALMALGAAVAIGIVHSGTHLTFGDESVFDQAGVTEAGIAVSLAAAALAFLG